MFYEQCSCLSILVKVGTFVLLRSPRLRTSQAYITAASLFPVSGLRAIRPRKGKAFGSLDSHKKFTDWGKELDILN